VTDQQPVPPIRQLTFDNILGIHAHLTNLKKPSDTIKTCITKLEQHILAFINSLSTGPTK